MSGYEKRAIPEALDEAINGAVSSLEMLAHGRDLVTGDNIEMVHVSRIASAAHDALSKAWNDAALEEAPADSVRREAVAEIGWSDDGYKIGYLLPLRSHRLPIGTKLYTRPAPAVSNDVVYADADALIAHLDELIDDNGQGGEKWDPEQAAIAGIRAWQRGSEAAVKRVADALSAQGWATGGDPDEFLDDVRAAMTLALAQPQDREAQAVDLEQFREAVNCWLDSMEGSESEAADKDYAEANRLLALIDAQSDEGSK